MGKLSVTQQKMVEIARALTTKAKAIVLDEPTDVLEDRSRNDLFEVIHQLKEEQGVGFIYISHRYAEVYELGDRVTILRDGKNVGTFNIADITFDKMIERDDRRADPKAVPGPDRRPRQRTPFTWRTSRGKGCSTASTSRSSGARSSA